MAAAIGVISKAGFKFESGNYGVAISLGSGDQLYFSGSSWNLSNVFQNQPQSAVYGGNASQKISRIIEGSISISPTYKSIALLTAALGDSAKSFSPQQVALGVYQHYINPGFVRTRTPDYFDDNSDTSIYSRGTLCVDNGVSIWQIDGSYIESWSFSVRNGRVSFSFNISGRELKFDPSTNNSSSSWTLPESETLYETNLEIYLKPLNQINIPVLMTLNVTDAGGNGNIFVQAFEYAAENLADRLEGLLNANGTLNGVYKVKFNHFARRFEYSCDINFVIKGTGTINSTIGLENSDTASAKTYFSYHPIKFKMEAFAAGDKVSVDEFSLNFSGNLERETTLNSDPFVDEAKRGKSHETSGSFKIPRYENNDVLNRVRSATYFEMRVKFTGNDLIGTAGTHNEEFYIDLPSVMIDKASLGISKSITPINFEFIADWPVFFNPENSTQKNYIWRSVYKGFTSEEVRFLFNYKGNLYVNAYDGSSTSEVFLIEGGALVDTGYTTTWGTLLSSLEYNGNLLVGADDNKIYKYDGSSWSNVGTLGGDVVSIVVFNEKLYAIDAAGNVYTSSNGGDSWVFDDVYGTKGYQLLAYNDELFFLVKDGTTATTHLKILEPAVTSVKNFGADSIARMVLHNGLLFAYAGSKFGYYDGSAWTDFSDLYDQPFGMSSYLGQLILCMNIDDEHEVSVYDFNGSSRQTIKSLGVDYFGADGSFIVKGNQLNNRLFFPAKTNGTLTCIGIPDIMLTFQNNLTTNPME